MSEFVAIYVLTSNDQILVDEKIFLKENQLMDIISGGIVDQLKEVTSNLQTDSSSIMYSEDYNGLQYNVKKFGDISVAFVSDMNVEVDQLVHHLGWKFLRMYHDIDFHSSGKIGSEYSEFKSLAMDKVQEFLLTRNLVNEPQKRAMTPVAIYDLEYHLQQVAIAMMSFEKASLEDLNQELDLDLAVVSESLETLCDLGYITKIDTADPILYHI